MFTIERRTGRLVEARIFRLATVDDVDQYARAFTPKQLADHPTLLADHRPVVIYPQAVAERLVALFNRFNAHWERVAIVISPTNATLALQLDRVVRAANNPSRRVFIEAAEACQFLSETLLPLEMARASAFLDHAPESTRPSERRGAEKTR